VLAFHAKEPKGKELKTLAGIINDHIIWRKQLIKLAKSDIIKTYSGSALGWAWAIIRPAVYIFIFWFVFQIGLKVTRGPEGYPYVMWLMAGMLPWFFMDEMITQGMSSFLKYSYLITKMKFPVATIPTFVGISRFIINLILMVLMLVIFTLYGYPPDIYMLQLPIYMVLMIIFFSNWALFSSLLGALSRDFINLINSFTVAIFWLSGIFFDVRGMTNPIIKTMLLFNPVTFMVEGYRDVFIYKIWIWDKPKEILGFMVILLVMVSASTWAFKRLYKEIPDVL
jgi:teichoic acid transport system permease protein